VDDAADALVLLMTHYSDHSHVNVGSGFDISIIELARLVARVVGFPGRVVTDSTKPDGTPRKLLDIDKLVSLGWQPRIALADGLANTYSWFLCDSEDARIKPGSVQP
jgi:GDP-L-fucose synthase